jgi:hypothetical protein
VGHDRALLTIGGKEGLGLMVTPHARERLAEDAFLPHDEPASAKTREQGVEPTLIAPLHRHAPSFVRSL